MKFTRSRICLFVLVGSVPAAGCGSDGLTDGPFDPIDELHLAIFTNESEEGRALMVVGDTGSAETYGSRNVGVPDNYGPVTFSSSDPKVVSVSRASTCASCVVRLTALATGSVQIVARAQNKTASRRVDVSAEPLPIDALKVVLAPVSPSPVEALYDAQGSLSQVTLRVGTAIIPFLHVRRGGASVHYISASVQSTDPGVALVDACGPANVNPNCDIASRVGWITGKAPGVTTISVRVRNILVNFLVRVEAPL